MTMQEAIRQRIIELTTQKKWSANKLAEKSGVSPSAVKRTIKPYATTQNTSTEFIANLCFGLDISVREFWNSSLFDEIEHEEK